MQMADSYWYSNPKSPYPFTTAQLKTIENLNFNVLICANSGLERIGKLWFNVPHETENPYESCSLHKQMNLSAWKEENSFA